MSYSYNSAAQSSANPYASASLYVGDLHNDVTEATLFELFNAVGPVASIRVCRDAQSRRSLGYAYVNFHSVQDAERALDTMNFTSIRNRACRIMWSQRDPTLRKSGKGNIFVKNLHETIDNKTLYDTFSVFGNILSCKVMRGEDGKSLKYGYVHYVSEEAANKAISGVNGMLISEMKVIAEPFKPREERDKERKFLNVYVKYIPTDWGKERLIKLFQDETAGIIESAYYKETDYGVFACLNFNQDIHARLAVEKLNGYDTGDESARKLYVARAQKRAERLKYFNSRGRGRGTYPRGKNYQGVNLYVKNLNSDINDEKLKDIFKEYGPITSARVMVDNQTKKSRGFGFVCFEKKEDAVRAMTEMNSKIIDGKPLYVSRAQRKAARQAWLSGQRSRMRMQNFSGGGSGYFGMPGMNQTPMGPRGPQPFMGQFNRGPYPRANLLQQQMYPSMMHLQMQQRPPSYVQPQHGYPIRMPLNPMAAYHPNSSVTQQISVTNPNVAPIAAGPRSAPQQPTPQMSASQLSQSHGQLTAQLLSSVKPSEQKRLIGERLFPRIQQVEPRLAGKITGMLLEMDNTELLHLLDSQDQLMRKINEALQVLKEHQTQSNPNTQPVE